MSDFDFVIRGATIVDGTRRPRFQGDVGISDGLIREVGNIAKGAGKQELEVDGLALAPGFIDVHTHFDAQIFWDPSLTPSNWHGVTTVVMANCGFGIAPLRKEHRELLIRTFERVEGMPADVLAAGVPWDEFETWPEMWKAVERRPKRINTALYIGHTPLRYYVMGEEATERAATTEEIDKMCAIVAEALHEGAIGFATSVRPTAMGAYGRPIPSRLASVEELMALGRELGKAKHGIFYTIHGPGKDDFWIDQFGQLSRETGQPLAWAPLLTGEYGPRGKAMEILNWQDSQNADLWTEVSSLPTTNQHSFARPGVFAARFPTLKSIDLLSPEDKIARMRTSEWREAFRQEVAVEPRSQGIFERMFVADTEKHSALRGRSLADIGRERGVDPFDVWVDLSLEEDNTTRFDIHINNDDEVELAEMFQHPRVIFALSDAGAHPSEQCDASFPTYLLSHWYRETGVLSLEDAVWRLSGQPAEAFRIEGRGVIAPGKVADLVAFDPETVQRSPLDRIWDLPTGHDRLVSYSTGIEHMWVGGTLTRTDGKDIDGVYTGSMIRGDG